MSEDQGARIQELEEECENLALAAAEYERRVNALEAQAIADERRVVKWMDRAQAAEAELENRYRWYRSKSKKET